MVENKNSPDLVAFSREMGGLVVILTDGDIVLWEGLYWIFLEKECDPRACVAKLKDTDVSVRRAAVRFLREVLVPAIEKRFGSKAELGRVMSDGSIHRVKFADYRDYAMGSILPRSVLTVKEASDPVFAISE